MFHIALTVSLIAMIAAQLIKFPIYYLMYKKWFPMIVFSTGGMPSSHSAFVTALTIMLGLIEGFNTVSFAISFVVASVVIHDSIGIRREAGRHATVLNDMANELDIIINEMKKGEEANSKIIDKKLKELLGHEPIEAITGTLFGVLVAFGYYYTLIY